MLNFTTFVSSDNLKLSWNNQKVKRKYARSSLHWKLLYYFFTFILYFFYFYFRNYYNMFFFNMIQFFSFKMIPYLWALWRWELISSLIYRYPVAFLTRWDRSTPSYNSHRMSNSSNIQYHFLVLSDCRLKLLISPLSYYTTFVICEPLWSYDRSHLSWTRRALRFAVFRYYPNRTRTNRMLSPLETHFVAHLLDLSRSINSCNIFQIYISEKIFLKYLWIYFFKTKTQL